MKHVYITPETCDYEHGFGNCPYCDGGLRGCSVCGGAEGTLTTDCCGKPLSGDFQDDIMGGTDYRDGRWYHARFPLRPVLDNDKIDRLQMIVRDGYATPEAIFEAAAAREIIPMSWLSHPRNFAWVLPGSAEVMRSTFPRYVASALRFCMDVTGVEAAEAADGNPNPVWVHEPALFVLRPVPVIPNEDSLNLKFKQPPRPSLQFSGKPQAVIRLLSMAENDYRVEEWVSAQRVGLFIDSELRARALATAAVWRTGYIPCAGEGTLGIFNG